MEPAAGYQVGARRTFPITIEEAWSLITGTPGLPMWLGDVGADFAMKAGQAYQTVEGISGVVRVVNLHMNIHLTWKREHWNKPSTVQVRTIVKDKHKTTISFHQENMPSAEVKEEMKNRWKDVLDQLETLIVK